MLHWILRRVHDGAQGTEHVFGVSPSYEDLNWQGLDFSRSQYQSVSSIDHAAWQQETQLHADLFKQLAHHLPSELERTRQRIEATLAA